LVSQPHAAPVVQNFLFVTKKTAKYFQMKRNPRKLPWTQFYRHLHRKGNANEDAKKSKVGRTPAVSPHRHSPSLLHSLLCPRRFDPPLFYTPLPSPL
jgi:hypothetical protein